jgi:hypothetical protein
LDSIDLNSLQEGDISRGSRGLHRFVAELEEATHKVKGILIDV